MKIAYLVSELKKWLSLQDRCTDAFLESITCDGRKREYIRSKVLPVIEKDCERQTDVVVNEAKRLLEENDAKCKNNSSQA